MRSQVYALAVAIAGFGLATGAWAQDVPAETQTSPEQVQMCQEGTQQCEAGDQGGCVTALKTCVGEARQAVMALMAEG